MWSVHSHYYHQLCLSTFYKDGELDYTYAAVTIDLATGNEVGQFKDIQNVGFFECPVCRFIVKRVVKVCEEPLTKALIESALTQICSPIPSSIFRRLCDDTVHHYFSKFVSLILRYKDDGKVCRLIRLCESQSVAIEEHEFVTDNSTYITPNPIPSEEDVKIGECLVCKAIVKAVKEIVKHSFTRDQVKRALSKVCRKVHSNKCQSFLNKHFNQLVDLISNGATRGRVCRIIRVCSSRTSAEIGFDQIDITLPDYEIAPFQEENALSQEENVEIGECLVCKAIVKAVKEIVKHSFTKDQVKRALSKVCRKVHSNKCQSFLNKHFNQLVDLISNGATRGRVCRIIRVCSSHSSAVTGFDQTDITLPDYEIAPLQEENIPFQEENALSQEENVEIGECLVCKAIVKAVKEIVKHSFTKDQVRRALSKVCRKVHSNRCQSFLNKHFNQLVDLISNGATRGRVCRIILVCSSDTSDEIYLDDFSQTDYTVPDYDIIPYQEENVEIGECFVCKAIVKGVKEIVKHSFTKDQVKKALSKVCRKVHSNKCQGFLNKHFNQLVDLISNGATRGKVCRVLLVCSSDTSAETYLDDYDQIDYTLLDYAELSSIGLEDVDKYKPDCGFCKVVVNLAKVIIKTSDNRDQMRDALRKACSQLNRFCSRCQNFVNKYSDRLIDLLQNSATRNRVCSLLRVCSAYESTSPFFARSLSEDVKQDDDAFTSSEVTDVDKKKHDCAICKAVVATAKAIIKTSYNRDQIKDALRKVCSKLHKFGSKCQNFVNKYSDRLIDLLQNAATRNRVCSLLKLCSDDESTSLTPDYTVLEDAKQDDGEFRSSEVAGIDKKKHDCAICKAVVATAKAIIKTSYNRDQIKDALRKVCSKLHKFGSKCQNFVNKYSDRLIDLLQNAATRNRVCSLLKLCSADEDTSLTLDYALSEDVGLDDDEFRSWEVTDIDKKKHDCAICKAVVATAKAIIKTSYNRDQIKDALRKVCSKLHKFGSKCQNFVNKYSDRLIDLLQNAATRNRVCSLLKLCSADEDTSLSLDYALSEDVEQDDDEFRSSDVADIDKKKHDCAICKAVIATAKAIIKTSYNRDQIKDALRKVCSKLHKFGSKCQNFVNKYSDRLIDLLQNAATRNRVCSLLKLCSADEDTSLSLDYALSEDVKQDDDEIPPLDLPDVDKKKRDCAICKAVVATAKAIIRTSYNRDQIKDALTKVCGKLHKFGSKCQNFVNKYFNTLIDLLQNAATRNRVCSLLKLCSADDSTALLFGSALSEDVDPDENTNGCHFCEFALSQMKAMVLDFAAIIQNQIFNICGVMPDPLRDMCMSEVKMHWQQWMKMIHNLKERKVCHLIRLCTVELYTSEENNLSGNNQYDSCMTAGSLMEKIVKIPSAVQKLHEVVYQICDHISPSLNVMCKAEIDSHWDEWILVIQTTSVQQMCRDD